MPDGQWTWRGGKLVPLTEELRQQDLRKVSEGFVDKPGESPRLLSRAEKRRAKKHMFEGRPWFIVAVDNFLDFFGIGGLRQ